MQKYLKLYIAILPCPSLLDADRFNRQLLRIHWLFSGHCEATWPFLFVYKETIVSLPSDFPSTSAGLFWYCFPSWKVIKVRILVRSLVQPGYFYLCWASLCGTYSFKEVRDFFLDRFSRWRNVNFFWSIV